MIPHDKQTGQEICPTDSNSPEECPIICPCLKHNITSQFDFEEGATLLFTPAGLMESARREWEKNVNDEFEGNPCMLIAHGETKESDPMKFKGRTHSGLLIQDGIPGNEADRYVILTTTGSYPHQVLTRCNFAGKKSWRMHSDNIAWGLVVRDESHMEISKDNQQFVILRKLNEGLDDRFHPRIFCVTGTPLSDMLRALEPWVMALRGKMAERFEWRADTVLRDIDEEWFREVETSFQQLKKLGFGSDKYKTDARALAEKTSPFLREFMIRHNATTKIFGKYLVDLPPQEYRDINCGIISSQTDNFRVNERSLRKRCREKFRKRWDAWKTAGDPPEKEPKPTLKEILDSCKNQRIITNVPALYDLHGQGKVDLTWAQISEKEWHVNPKASPYYKNIRLLYHSSSKLQEIAKIQTMLQGEKHGIDHQQEGLVIMSENPVMVFIIHCVRY
jgi:hypothetical protein